MRCARCDRIVRSTRLARDRSDRLVFGWCDACLSATGCTVLEGPSVRLRARRPPLRRRVRRLADSWQRSGGLNGPAGRRLAMLVLSAILGVWSLVLALLGGWRWLSPPTGPVSPLGNGTSALLLAGAGGMAVLGLVLWSALLAPPRRRALLRRLGRFTIGLVASLAFALAVSRATGSPARLVLSSALAGYLASWLLTSRRRPGRGDPFTTAAPIARGPKRPTRPS